MMGSFNGLIQHIINEVALNGNLGANVQDISKYVRSFYSDSQRLWPHKGRCLQELPQALDSLFWRKCWDWLDGHPEIEIREISRPSRAGFEESQADGWRSMKARAGSIDIAQPWATESWPLGLDPSFDQKTVHVSEERLWLALTGHGPDSDRVPTSDFTCLSAIAKHREQGITQPQLVKATGQDKRSVPTRTQRLFERGYITKTSVTIGSMKTSLLVLKKFVVGEGALNQKLDSKMFVGDFDGPHQPSLGRQLAENETLIREAIQTICEFYIVTWHDLKLALGISQFPWQIGLLANAFWAFEELGCIELAKLTNTLYITESSQLKKRQFVMTRTPVSQDWKQLFEKDWENVFDGVRNCNFWDPSGSTRHHPSHPFLAEDEFCFITPVGSPQKTMSLWTEDGILVHLLRHLINHKRARGSALLDIKHLVAGKFYGRPIDNLISRTVDCWQISQPSHLRHLGLLKDSDQSGRTGYYVYQGETWYALNVGRGEKIWEAVRTMIKDAKISRLEKKYFHSISSLLISQAQWKTPFDTMTLSRGEALEPQKSRISMAKKDLKAHKTLQPLKAINSKNAHQFHEQSDGAMEISLHASRSLPQSLQANANGGGLNVEVRSSSDGTSYAKRLSDDVPNYENSNAHRPAAIPGELHIPGLPVLRHPNDSIRTVTETDTGHQNMRPDTRTIATPKIDDSCQKATSIVPILPFASQSNVQSPQNHLQPRNSDIRKQPKTPNPRFSREEQAALVERSGPGVFLGSTLVLKLGGRGRPPRSQLLIISSPRLINLSFFRKIKVAENHQKPSCILKGAMNPRSVTPKRKFDEIGIDGDHLHRNEDIPGFGEIGSCDFRLQNDRKESVQSLLPTARDWLVKSVLELRFHPLQPARRFLMKQNLPWVDFPTAGNNAVSSLRFLHLLNQGNACLEHETAKSNKSLRVAPRQRHQTQLSRQDPDFTSSRLEMPNLNEVSLNVSEAALKTSSTTTLQAAALTARSSTPSCPYSSNAENLFSKHQLDQIEPTEPSEGTDVAGGKSEQTHSEEVNASFLRLNRFGGSLASMKKNLMVDIIRSCGGVFPGGKELWYPFAARWASKPGATKSDQRTVNQIKRDLISTGRIKQVTFTFQNKQGIAVIKSIVSLPELSSADPRILRLREKMTFEDPRMYFPEPARNSIEHFPVNTRDPTHQLSNQIADFASQVGSARPVAKPTFGSQKNRSGKNQFRLKETPVSRQKNDRKGSGQVRDDPPTHDPDVLRRFADSSLATRTHHRQGTENTIASISRILPNLPRQSSQNKGSKDICLPKSLSNKRRFLDANLEGELVYSQRHILLILSSLPSHFHAPSGTFASIDMPFSQLFNSYQPLRKRVRNPAKRIGKSSRPSSFKGGKGNRESCQALAMGQGDGSSRFDALEVESPENRLFIESRLRVAQHTGYQLPHFEQPTTKEPEPEPDPIGRILVRKRSLLPHQNSISFSFSRQLLSQTYSRSSNEGEENDFQKLRSRGPAIKNDLRIHEDWKVYVAVMIVRTLVGGLSRAIAWPLVTKMFEPVMDLKILVQKWNRVRVRFAAASHDFQESFQNVFINAYRKGLIPHLDYNKTELYDWRWLLQWSLERVLFSPASTCELPLKQKSMSSHYYNKILTNECNSDFWEARSRSVISKRYLAAHKICYVTLFSKPRAITPIRDVEKAKNLIRANVLTIGSSYSPVLARKHLSYFNEEILNMAVDRLLSARCISRGNRGKAFPGRSYEISDYAFGRVQLRLPMALFEAAHVWKTQIDEDLQDQDGRSLSSNIGDAEALVVINLLAHERIHLRQVGIPTYASNIGENQSSDVDRDACSFTLEFEPTPTYTYGNPLYPVPVAPRNSSKIQTANAARILPVWVDINNDEIRDVWRLALAAVLCIGTIRPGAPLTEVTAWLEPLFSNHDIGLVMEWLASTNAASWVGPFHEGLRLEEWWWLASAVSDLA